ncbi:MAG: HK97 family phage prohead protease [Chloroflexota bacterium]|nr:HK97 family phage prohead protease [Chloroflexota bacterium]
MKPDLKRKFLLDFDFKAVGEGADGGVYVEGYASTYQTDRDGEAVSKAAWNKGLGEYLDNPIICLHHDLKQGIGRVVEHKVDSGGLWIKAYISSGAGNVVQLIKDGVYRAFSIGGLMRVAKGIIEEVKLYEISVVGVPANPTALFEVATKAFQLDASSDGGAALGAKAGRVLSTKNEGLIQSARDNLDTVLSSLEKDESKSVWTSVSGYSDTVYDPVTGEPASGWADFYASGVDLEAIGAAVRDLISQMDEWLQNNVGGTTNDTRGTQEAA